MLFEEQVSRQPNLYPWTQTYIDNMWKGFWTPNEFNFKSDYSNFKSDLSEEERRIIVKTLSAIGQVEIAVKKYWAQLGDRFPHPSMSDLGFVMANSEVIHNQAYEKLLSVLALKKVFAENLQEPTLQGRVNYLRKYLQRAFDDDKKQQIYALILFTLFVENVSLFSQFYIILHFNSFKNVLKDTAQQVQYTKNEEMLHASVGIKLINTLREEYPELFDDDLVERIIEEVDAAFTAESGIIDWIIGDYSHENLNATILKEFIKKRINDSLEQIGISYALPTDEALIDRTYWFDEVLYGNAMTDFFHGKPIEYAKNDKSYDHLFE